MNLGLKFACPTKIRTIARSNRRILALLLTATVVSLLADDSAGGGELQQFTLKHDGRNRRFAVYVPDGYSAATPWPLVINMHGATSNRAEQISISQMNPVADVGNFLVAYPEAVGGLWNDSLSSTRPDDIGFVNALIDRVNADFAVEPSKVYAAGFSQGGAMSYLLANALPERIAAIASVSGSPGISDDDGPFSVDLTVAPTTSRAFPILYFVGTADSEQFAGGSIPVANGIVVPPFTEIMEAWAVNNGCELERTAKELPDVVIDDGPTTVTRHDFIECDTYSTLNGDDVVAEVSYFLIEDGGHAWPGGGVGGDGNQNQDINASEEIWDFFSRHSLPANINVEPILGDFDGDKQLTATDIDLLSTAVGSGDTQFDLDGNGVIEAEDRRIWVEDVFGTFFGDADLNHEVAFADFLTLSNNFSATGGWDDGDFNGNGQVDFEDFLQLSSNFGKSNQALATVPEPKTGILLLAGLLVSLIRRRRVSEIRGPQSEWPGEKGTRTGGISLVNLQIVGTLILLATFSPLLMADGQLIDKELVHDGLQRTYSLYLPESYEGNEDWPLVINMHGAFSRAEDQMFISDMNAVADAHQFLVAYPQSAGELWREFADPVDDVRFIETMIESIEHSHAINPSKVYATGLSLGGRMTYSLAAGLSDRIAAIAAVSSIPIKYSLPARPLPVLLMQGTADALNPIEGGYVERLDVVKPSMNEILESWLDRNHCDTNRLETLLPDLNLEDESTVTRFDYSSCAPYITTSGETKASEVVYYEIENGGHAWPGGAYRRTVAALNRDINASEVIWEFFSHHELPRSPRGDFDGNNVLDAKDIDLLSTELHLDFQRAVFDINQDGIVTIDDHGSWVLDLRQTWLGDADLNGEVGFEDFLLLANHFDGPGGWGKGDFDGDGQVRFGDFLVLASNYGKTSTGNSAAVPEPSSSLIAALALFLLAGVRNRMRSFDLPHACPNIQTVEVE